MFFTIQVFSQKIDFSYINKKTNDTIVATVWQNLIDEKSMLLNVRFLKENSQVYMQLRFNFGSKNPFIISKTDSLWLKLESGYTMKIAPADTGKSGKGISTIESSPRGLTTQGVDILYPVSLFELMALQTDPVEKLRIFSSEEPKTAILDSRPKRIIKDNAELINQKITNYVVTSVGKSEQRKAENSKSPDNSPDQW